MTKKPTPTKKIKDVVSRASNKLPDSVSSKLQRNDSIDAKVPQITTQNIAEHREEVLKGARKFIVPLQQSKKRILNYTVALFLALVLVFSITSVVLLYRNQSTSKGVYRLTKIIPFPVARTGTTFIEYENYLFELRHYIHYYENKQELSFDTDFGRAQLADYKKRALDKVVNDAYIKKIAKDNDISVSEEEVDEQIRIAREQNRLGSSDQVFEDVLRDFWDWSVDDFRRSLKSEILLQKVLVNQDTGAVERATQISEQLADSDSDFAKIAKESSDDVNTKEQGGDFGFVDKTSRTVSQKSVDTLYGLEEGQVSEPQVVPFGTGYALSIIKFTDEKDGQRRGSQIIIQLETVDEMLNDIKEEKPYRLYISEPTAEEAGAIQEESDS